MKITNYGWSTSEASPRTAEIPNHCHRQAAAGDRPSGRVHSGTPRSVIPTAAVRCAKVQSASRPAGHSESGWSDNVSADVERTPDATSSTENLTQTFSSRRPRIPAPLPRRCSEPVAPTGSSAVRGDVRHRPQASNPRWPMCGGTLWSWSGRGVCALRSGRRVGDAGTPAGWGRPMIPVGTRCLRLRPSDVGDVGAAALPSTPTGSFTPQREASPPHRQPLSIRASQAPKRHRWVRISLHPNRQNGHRIWRISARPSGMRAGHQEACSDGPRWLCRRHTWTGWACRKVAKSLPCRSQCHRLRLARSASR